MALVDLVVSEGPLFFPKGHLWLFEVSLLEMLPHLFEGDMQPSAASQDCRLKGVPRGGWTLVLPFASFEGATNMSLGYEVWSTYPSTTVFETGEWRENTVCVPCQKPRCMLKAARDAVVSTFTATDKLVYWMHCSGR